MDWMRRGDGVCRSGTAPAGGSGEGSPGGGYRPRADDGMICRAVYGDIVRAEGESGEKSIRFSISFSSETPVDGEWWGGPQVLIHTAEAVRLDRLRRAGVLLFDHGWDPNYGAMPVGLVDNIKLDPIKRRCTADIVLDDGDPKAMELARKIEKKILSGISFRGRVIERQILREGEKSADGRYQGPMALVTKWEPYEVSIEPIPADPRIGIGRSMGNLTGMREEQNMGNETNIVTGGAPVGQGMPAAPAAAPAAEGVQRSAAPEGAPTASAAPAAPTAGETGVARSAVPAGEDAIRAERERSARIVARCGSFPQLGLDPGDFIARGLSVNEVNEEILRRLGSGSAPVGGSVQVVADETDKLRSAACDGLLLRAGMRVEKPADGARDFRGMRLRDLAVDCVTRAGVQGALRMADDVLMRSALSPDSAFSGILSDTINKSMGIAYHAAPTTFERWTSKGSNTDFKPRKIFQISEAGELDEVPQNGELKFDAMKDTSATSVLATFGKTFGFTRQALINDDLDLLTRIPAAYVSAAKRGVNRAVYSILNANPVMADGNALFSAAHGNLGTGAKPSVDSYQEAMGGMMTQKNLRGLEYLNIPPAFVITSPLQYAEHAVILRSTANPDGANSGVFNPFEGMMTLVQDANIQAASGVLPYYFAADPSMCGTIEVCYLNGVEEPQLESQVGFDFLGIKYRIIHDRGVTLLDWRGLYKNPGPSSK